MSGLCSRPAVLGFGGHNIPVLIDFLSKANRREVSAPPVCLHLWARGAAPANQLHWDELGRALCCPGGQAAGAPGPWTTSLCCLERGLQRALLALASASETKAAKRISKGLRGLRPLSGSTPPGLDKDKMAVHSRGVQRTLPALLFQSRSFCPALSLAGACPSRKHVRGGCWHCSRGIFFVIRICP